MLALRATAQGREADAPATDSVFAWIESSGIAQAIASSTAITGSLSAVHVTGFMLVTGSALVANLGSLGVLFRGRPTTELVGPANRAILLGLAISVVTGALLFSARATDVSMNGTFRLKMLLLIAAALFHFVVHRRAAARGEPVARIATFVGLALWLALAVTACAFILLE